MVEKRCRAARTHKPHLWSRTTKKTVTDETPGDTFSCPGSAKLGLREEVAEKDDRNAQIAADARSGRNWAEETAYGPACICGAGLRTFRTARAFQGLYGRPTGFCPRHPGGSVMRDTDWGK